MTPTPIRRPRDQARRLAGEGRLRLPHPGWRVAEAHQRRRPRTQYDVRPRKLEPATRVEISAEGRFTLPPGPGPFLLAAVAESGFTCVSRLQFRPDAALRFRAWARITGSVKTDGTPVNDITIMAGPSYTMAPVVGDGEPRLEHSLVAKTDEDGQFELPRVIPGRLELAQLVPNGTHKRLYLVNLATLDIEAGHSYTLKIGERGRPVTGRLAIPKSSDWLVREATIRRKGSDGRSIATGIRVFPDGRFRAEDLEAGNHTCIDVHEQPPADTCGWGRFIAAFTHDFAADGRPGDGPHDLGLLQPARLGPQPLQAGERVPRLPRGIAQRIPAAARRLPWEILAHRLLGDLVCPVHRRAAHPQGDPRGAP